MHLREEFEGSLLRYRRLLLAWTGTVLLLLAAHALVSFSFGLAFLLFALGAISLGATGISCAYTIARDAFE